MARCCLCTRRAFFQMGGILGCVMCFTSIAVALQCPYSRICPAAYYFIWLVAMCSIAMGCALTCIGCSVNHIASLDEDKMTPTNMTTGTKRWGCVAKTCPCISRWLLTTAGLFAFLGLLLGTSQCPKKGAAEWEDEWCMAPPNVREPDPKYDFGMVIGCWLMIAAMGCCASRDKAITPITYEPIPEMPPDVRWRCLACASRCTRYCHP
uniref:Uncharacterized protein n=1 Tax=Alexandrium monilatum TaxID=311494 RepID=A0A7S4SDP5_9DINO